MKSLDQQPDKTRFIVPLFYGHIALYSTRPTILKRFEGHNIQPITTTNGLNYLEIRIEQMTMNCFLNSDDECYTCWICIDDLEDPEPYIGFYNQYFSLSDDHPNYWDAKTDGATLELIHEKEGYYLVM